MDESNLTQIKSLIGEISTVTQKALDDVTSIEGPGGARFETSKIVPTTGFSIAEHHGRVALLVELVRSLARIDAKHYLTVPSSHLAGLPTELTSVVQAFDDISLAAQAVLNDGGCDTFESESFTARSKNGTHSVNLPTLYHNVQSHTDVALERAQRIRGFVARDQKIEFSGAAEQVSKLIASISQIKHTISDHLLRSTAERQDSEQNSKSVEAASKAAADDRKKIEEALGKVQEDRASIEKLLANVDEIKSRAESLRTQVESFQSKFTEFDTRLEDRNRIFDEGTGKFNELTASLSEADRTATQIIDNAKNALQWGTADALSKSFAEEAKALDQPIVRARNSLYFSLGLLAVWIPAMFIVPQWLQVQLPNLTVPAHLDGWSVPVYMITSLGTRLALIVPALWFVVFAADRYRTAHLTREQYVFKKTIASAIPGFKEHAASKDADDHVKAMTIAAFERLLFNPREDASRDLAGTARGGPLSRWLVRLVGQAIENARDGLEKKAGIK